MAFLNNLSLYIHIPFCQKKCNYCDFFSKPYDSEKAAAVLDKILAQTAYYLDRCGNPPVETIYIGGGTPNILSFDQLTYFLINLQSILTNSSRKSSEKYEREHAAREFTIECNPHLLNTDLISLFGECGITRLSIGVQTLQPLLLKALGREVTPEAVYASLEIISRYWKGSLSVDFISGIPGQTEQNALDDLAAVNRFSPHHISLYSLSIEPETGLAEQIKTGSITPLSEDEEFAVWQTSLDFLKDRGYRRYEISNFEINGNPSKHNIRYWHMLPYLGCGPAAVSTLYEQGNALRIEQCSDIDTYLSGKPPDWKSMKEVVSSARLLFEVFMMGFRLSDGIDLDRINRMFAIEWEPIFGPLFRTWEETGYLRWRDKKTAALTEKGWQYNNQLLVRLLQHIETAGPEHPDISPFP